MGVEITIRGEHVKKHTFLKRRGRYIVIIIQCMFSAEMMEGVS